MNIFHASWKTVEVSRNDRKCSNQDDYILYKYNHFVFNVGKSSNTKISYFLDLNEYPSKYETKSLRSNKTYSKPYEYEGNFHYFTEETTKFNIVEESTTIFDGTDGVSMNTLRTSMERNVITNNPVLKRHKNANSQLVVDQRYTNMENSSGYSSTEEVNGLIKNYLAIQKEKVYSKDRKISKRYSI